MIINGHIFDEGALIKIIDYSNNEFVGFARKPYWLARFFGYKVALSMTRYRRLSDSIIREPYPFKPRDIKGIEKLE